MKFRREPPINTTPTPPLVKRSFFRWDPLATIAVVALVFLVSQITAQVIISAYPAYKNWTGPQSEAWLQDSVYAQFIYILLAETFAVWLVLKIIRRLKVQKQKIGLVLPRLRDVAYALVGYGVYFVGYIIILVLVNRFSHLDTEQAQNIGFTNTPANQLYLVFISLVVLPPIGEEILFRGFLFTSFRQKFRFHYAVVLTSILFGIAHLQFGNGAPLLWVAALDTFTLSCVLCTLREKSGSLWPGIYLHALKNGIAFVALFHTKF